MIDIAFSGTTTVSVVIRGTYLLCANAGDSRAIMCRKEADGWKAIPLNRDHKPDDKNEKERILKFGGRIESFKDINGDPIGP